MVDADENGAGSLIPSSKCGRSVKADRHGQDEGVDSVSTSVDSMAPRQIIAARSRLRAI